MARNGVWTSLYVTQATGAPPAVGKPALFASSTVQNIDYRGSNGHIYELYNYTPNNNSTWHFADLFSLATPTPPPSSGNPATAYTSLPENVVVYIDAQRHVHQLSAAGAWSHQDLTSLASCPMTAVAGTDPVIYA